MTTCIKDQLELTHIHFNDSHQERCHLTPIPPAAEMNSQRKRQAKDQPEASPTKQSREPGAKHEHAVLGQLCITDLPIELRDKVFDYVLSGEALTTRCLGYGFSMTLGYLQRYGSAKDQLKR